MAKQEPIFSKIRTGIIVSLSVLIIGGIGSISWVVVKAVVFDLPAQFKETNRNISIITNDIVNFKTDQKSKHENIYIYMGRVKDECNNNFKYVVDVTTEIKQLLKMPIDYKELFDMFNKQNKITSYKYSDTTTVDAYKYIDNVVSKFPEKKDSLIINNN